MAVEQLRRLQAARLSTAERGADKGYHSRHFVESLRRLKIKPYSALRCNRDPMGVILNAAHQASQRVRNGIEEILGWVKTVGGFRKSRYRGVARTHAASQYVVAAHNLLRMTKLQSAT